MSDPIPGPSAALLDVWGRVAWLVGVVLLVVWVVLASQGSLAIIPVGVLVAAAIGGAIALGVRSSRAVRLEKDAGYSTLFDFAGYELRDARTKQLLRAADVMPAAAGRRSIFRSMLSVKPGTVLAKRLEEDE